MTVRTRRSLKLAACRSVQAGRHASIASSASSSRRQVPPDVQLKLTSTSANDGIVQ